MRTELGDAATRSAHNGAIRRPNAKILILAVFLAVCLAGLLCLTWRFVDGQSDPQVSRLLAYASLVGSVATVLLAAATLIAVREAGRQAAIAQEGLTEARNAVSAANSEAAASLTQAEASDRLAKAAGEQATQTARTAKAAEDTIAEMRQARAFEYRPHLVVRPGSEWDNSSVHAIVKNIGRGPALRCFAAAHWFDEASGHLWGVSDGFELGANDESTVEIEGSESIGDADQLVGDRAVDGRGRAFAIVFLDLIGNRYRLTRDAVGTHTDVLDVNSLEGGSAWARYPGLGEAASL